MSLPGNINQLLIGAAASGGSEGPIKSVRFDKDSSGHLNKTFGTATDTKKFTISFWVKRIEFSQATYLLTAGTGTQGYLNFDAGIIRFYGVNGDLKTNAVYRDPSAWYHIVAVADTANSTTNDRMQLYVNGIRLTDANGDFATHTQPTQDATLGDWNSASTHYVNRLSSGNYQSFYMADFYFIDGQAKEATDFGAFDDNGVWQAAAYSGTFGTNGFHLFDFANETGIGDDSSGNDNDWTVNNLTNSSSAGTVGVTTTVPEQLTGDWLGVLGYTPSDTSGAVAVFPDGGGIGVTKGTFFWSGLTIGDTITWYGTSSGQTRQVTGDVDETTVSVPGASLGSFTLTVNAASGDAKVDFNGTANCYGITPGPLSSRYFDDAFDVPSNGTQDDTGVGGEVSANYCTWNPLSLQSADSITLRNGNLNATVGATRSSCFGTMPLEGKTYWEIVYNGGAYVFGMADASMFNTVANTAPNRFVGETSTSWGIGNDGTVYNGGSVGSETTWANGDVMGWSYDSSNGAIKIYKNGALNGSYTASTATTYFPAATLFYNGSQVDVNFGQRAFVYPLTGFTGVATTNLATPTIADGSDHFDIKLYTGNSTARSITGLNMAPDVVWIKKRSGSGNHSLADTVRGATKNLVPNDTQAEGTEPTYVTAFNSDGFSLGASSIINNNGDTYVSWAWNAGDSNTTINAGSLNSSFYDSSQTWSDDMSTSNGWTTNRDGTKAFDSNTQLISGASNTWAQTDTTGGTVTWTPDGYTIDTADEIFIKAISSTDRLTVVGSSSTESNIVPGTVDGVSNVYTVSTTLGTVTSLSVTNPTGLAGFSGIKVGGKVLVDTGVTPAVSFPSIASTVRANQTAGFSIVSYTGTGTASTIGHGLNAAPELLIIKNLDTTAQWPVYSKEIGAANKLQLNTTDASASTGHFNSTDPTSLVFSVGTTTSANNNGDDLIAYCFAPVEGFSATGSYEGNGLADGPFVYTGFRISFLLIKISSGTTSNWVMLDSARDPYNVVENNLYADDIAAENQFDWVDFMSNGFKVRSTLNQVNGNGYDYIYLAFAENPFQANGGIAR